MKSKIRFTKFDFKERIRCEILRLFGFILGCFIIKPRMDIIYNYFKSLFSLCFDTKSFTLIRKLY